MKNYDVEYLGGEYTYNMLYEKLCCNIQRAC